MGTFIVFAEKQPQPPSGNSASRMAQIIAFGRREFGILVEEEPHDVATGLASGGFAPLTRIYQGKRRPVQVNAANVLYIEGEKVELEQEEEQEASAGAGQP